MDDALTAALVVVHMARGRRNSPAGQVVSRPRERADGDRSQPSWTTLWRRPGWSTWPRSAKEPRRPSCHKTREERSDGDRSQPSWTMFWWRPVRPHIADLTASRRAKHLDPLNGYPARGLPWGGECVRRVGPTIKLSQAWIHMSMN